MKTKNNKKTNEWIKTKIPQEYDLKGKILQFSSEDHKKESLFCRCTGGFGGFYKCSGNMILGNFYPTLQDAIDKTNEDGKGGNTRAFPICQYEEVKK